MDTLNLLNLIVSSNDNNLQKFGKQSDALEKILRASEKFRHTSFNTCAKNLASIVKNVTCKTKTFE